ncbi:cytochrome-c peroxidase [Flavobacterium zepuense]|uniref:Cytochrome-c peroxidase n=1 Tax=Flavobacterium zepuense TaxID=2593302 RepID=A0A552V1I7_9FLAO|nr:cytochrome c peroxidase [Flavobacterium zepuense]TRW24317.1 cytochrome-c peroxidase [Flavobacterium zepuense]
MINPVNFKVVKSILLLVCGCAVIFHMYSFSDKDNEYTQDEFRPLITKNVALLGAEINLLSKAAADYSNGTTSKKLLQQQHLKTRKAFKTVEGILEYYYPRHVKAYLNGPPLNHLDPYPVKEEYKEKGYYVVSPDEYSKSLVLDYLDTDHYRGERSVVAPEGLQALDELIFSEEEIDKGLLIKLAAQLKHHFIAVQIAIDKRNYFYDFEVLEASRLELVRIFSMGITGFDTPGSLNALPEAGASLAGMQVVTQPLVGKVDNATRTEINALFTDAVKYLNRKNDFDGFNRLEFLMQYINPLYKKLGEVQQALHLRSSAERWGKIPSWNANSTNIFGGDFLNPYHYSLLKEWDDSENLCRLGKQLFYDNSLSQTGTMSCASCHNPELGFTDGKPKSTANAEGMTVLRNSPTLINAVFSDRFFYDLRAYDLEDQAKHVIENHLEFNTSFEKLQAKLNANPEYVARFEKAFNKKGAISRYQFSAALSSYIISLRSFNSEFDQYVQGKTQKLSAQVQLGFNLFTGKAACATCHYVPTFGGLVPPLYQENESEVLGVLSKPKSNLPDTDAGRIKNGILEDSEEIYRGSFKTMTVRNAKLTAPYFHNGAYNTLSEVVDFYNNGGAAGIGLGYEVPNQTLPPDPLNLNKKEIAALIAFMEALTDNPYNK